MQRLAKYLSSARENPAAPSVYFRFNFDHFKMICYIIPSLTVISSYAILKVQKALPVTVGPVNSYKVTVNFAEWTVTFLLSELSDRSVQSNTMI